MTVVKGDPRQLTEKQFMEQVKELFTTLGWRFYHVYDARRSEPGFPDCVLIHPKLGIIFAELKRDKGRTTPAQDEWIDAINTAIRAVGLRGRPAVVWRPRDWDRVVDIAQRGLRHVEPA